MVSEGYGRLFRRKDGKYLIYLPKSLAEDSQFPFKDLQTGPRGHEPHSSVRVKVSFMTGKQKVSMLLVEALPTSPGACETAQHQ